MRGRRNSLRKAIIKYLEAINNFHVTCVNLLVEHQKKIINRQFELKRVADCMIDLYASGAVLSRATAAHDQARVLKLQKKIFTKS